jgi:ferredoxin
VVVPEIQQIQVVVKQEEAVVTLTPKLGQNLRELLLEAGVSPYRGAFRSLNCQGLGVCGSCRVKVLENGQWWSRRACQIRCFQSLQIELE